MLQGRFIRLSILTLALALASLISLDAQPAYAASITVNSVADTMSNDGFCTLREAIINANTDSNAGSVDCPKGTGIDTIHLPSDSTISLGTALSDIFSVITIEGNGSTIERGGVPLIPDFSIFTVNANGDLTLNDLTITNGRSPSGGGINNSGAIVRLNSSTVSGNVSTGNGGGINNSFSGLLILNKSDIINNLADPTTGLGGGIYNNNSLAEINNSTISGNSADQGGGINNNFAGTMTIDGSTINNNNATLTSGGILNFHSLTISNSTISGNTSDSFVGGIGVSADMTITNSTIVGNSSVLASPASGVNISPGNTLELVNTIIADNTPLGDCGGTGTINSQGGNLDSDNTCNLIHPKDIPGVNPMLSGLQDNGGLTLTHIPLAGSPVIDTGKNSACTATDQRGMVRPHGRKCDIGAVEATPDLAVSISHNPSDGQVGVSLIYTVEITNNGPVASTRAMLNTRLEPGKTSIQSVSSATGSCTVHSSARIECIFGTMNPGDTEAVDIEVLPTVAGRLRTGADVSGATSDPTPADNNAIDNTRVNP